VLNYECALFALEHAEVFSDQAIELRAQRAIVFEAFQGLPGVTAFKSEANMILARVPDPAQVFEGLKAHGVLVKNVSKMHPLLHHCIRITVGTSEENAKMLTALKASL
jgi:histidinol-phosphate aminotransferase